MNLSLGSATRYSPCMAPRQRYDYGRLGGVASELPRTGRCLGLDAARAAAIQPLISEPQRKRRLCEVVFLLAASRTALALNAAVNCRWSRRDFCSVMTGF